MCPSSCCYIDRHTEKRQGMRQEKLEHSQNQSKKERDRVGGWAKENDGKYKVSRQQNTISCCAFCCFFFFSLFFFFFSLFSAWEQLHVDTQGNEGLRERERESGTERASGPCAAGARPADAYVLSRIAPGGSPTLATATTTPLPASS